MTDKFKKALGYFHHREQSMLYEISKIIIETVPNCLVFLIESRINHGLVRNIFTKPQRLESWMHHYNILLIHEDEVSIDENFKEILNAIHSDVQVTKLQTLYFSDFIDSINEGDPESVWIHSRGLMLYGSDDFLTQLPSRKKYTQEEEEQFWFQYLSKSTVNISADD